MTMTTKLPPDYDNRVYAGWLGKCIGVRFGAPLENWTYEEIRDNLGELEWYAKEDRGKVFKPDDDTAVPMILIRALENADLENGQLPTAREIGETQVNYMADQQGTIWWGGYGISSEHTVYLNMVNGIPAPRSGSIQQNGAALAEQIGGQIFSDIWGLVAPNNPAFAADLAERAASVSHDGNGVYGGRFIAALVSAAFSERDPCRLIEIGLAQIPADSKYTRVIRAVLDFHQTNPDDWRAAFLHLKANFGYDRYPGIVHIIPNAGVVAIGLLYGAGDFSRAIRITNMCGWDTDCNVGNVGAIMGVAGGVDGIDTTWRDPMNDLLIAASLIGARNILTIPQCADLFCHLGRRLAGDPVDEMPPRYHFRYSGSTNNFQEKGVRGRVIHMQQEVLADGQPILRTGIRKLNSKGEVRLYTRTYYRPSELSTNYYGATFSPLIYPGQTVNMRVQLPKDAPSGIRAGLYAYDDNHGQSHQAETVELKAGEWHTLEYTIPSLTNACLSEVGIVLRNMETNLEVGSLAVAELDWGGAFDFATTFAKERAETGGISQWTRLRGYWRIEDGAYHGSGVGVCETYTGDLAWRDYEITADLAPLIGDYHMVNVRVGGALYGYAFGLAPEGKIGLYKKDWDYKLVASAPFAWRCGETYHVSVAANRNVISAHVEGAGGSASLGWADEESPYLRGMVGLSTWYGGHTRFLSVRTKGY
jgi:ADP-ribosylglycohydrolase